ncbi:MAG TPA: di-heme oxidoredictase family protein [Burkholderiaceae bacterium]
MTVLSTLVAPRSPRGGSRRTVLLGLLAVALIVLGVVAWHSFIAPLSGYGDQPHDLDVVRKADPRALSGGDLTTFHPGFRPFSQAAYNLPWKLQAEFDTGDALFDANFKPGPTIDPARVRGGLGPMFNQSSCSGCHFRDGSASPPASPGEAMNGMFLRISVPDGLGGWKPMDGYNTQIHDQAVNGVPPEGKGRVTYTEQPGRYPDGSVYSLRRPHYQLENSRFGPVPADAVVEARVAPRNFGGGLLEAIPENAILEVARQQAASGTGVHGRPNRVVDVVTGKTVLGRFAWKANNPTVIQQAADAFSNDMGLTTKLFPQQNCPVGQAACLTEAARQSSDVHEVNDAELDAMSTYLRLLAVPARRAVNDPNALRGEQLFHQVQCMQCHVDTFRTGDSHPVRRLRDQIIHPYTDLLLHDMGEGLSGRPDHLAGPRDWRTAPLWGVGLTEKVNRHTNFLHDGRARNLEEAVLWHGGEAEGARQRFMQLSAEDRRLLLYFLGTL